MSCAPDSSCENSFWDRISNFGEDGYGEITETTVVRPQTERAKAELEPVDEADAEVVQGWVAQVSRSHREALIQRYIYKRFVPRDTVDAAIHAVLLLKHENRRTVARMRYLRW